MVDAGFCEEVSDHCATGTAAGTRQAPERQPAPIDTVGSGRARRGCRFRGAGLEPISNSLQEDPVGWSVATSTQSEPRRIGRRERHKWPVARMAATQSSPEQGTRSEKDGGEQCHVDGVVSRAVGRVTTAISPAAAWLSIVRCASAMSSGATTRPAMPAMRTMPGSRTARRGGDGAGLASMSRMRGKLAPDAAPSAAPRENRALRVLEPRARPRLRSRRDRRRRTYAFGAYALSTRAMNVWNSAM